MFWKEARRKYANPSEDDEDVKKFHEFSAELQRDFYNGITGYLQDLGHGFIFSHIQKGNVLEIGFGTGRSGLFFRGDKNDYYPIDNSLSLSREEVWKRYKNAVIADARNIPFPDGYFDNVVSMGVLEHIKEIEAVMSEVQRTLKAKGRFIVGLPCEGGLAWNLGRELVTRPHVMKKYGVNYDKVIAHQHVHSLVELRKVLRSRFKVEKERFYPFMLPIADINVMYCALLVNSE